MKKLLKNKRFISLAMLVLMMSVMIVPTFAAEVTSVSYSDFESVITALQNQISVSTIVNILATLAGVCVGLVFLWWAVRKVVSALMSAFRNGKLSI